MRTSYIIMIIMVAAMFSSCSTTEKFYVSGTPNTKIYTPNYTHIATVGTNGKAKIEIPSDDYYAFFLSKSPNSELYVPFALDYKKKGRLGTQLIFGTGMGLAAAGTFAEIVGLIATIGGDEAVATPFFLGGAGAIALGTAIGMPANFRLMQTSYQYQYQYLNNQQTNEDLHFTKAVFNEPFKGASQAQTVKASTPIAVKEGTSVSKKRLSDKSSKTLKDYGKQTEGVYVGNGTLTQNGETIESYVDIKVIIDRVSKNEVNVNVIEADGAEFFEAPSKYKITKNKNGSYTLKHSSISIATITINKNGSLTYHHPKINIDGEIYVLKISAKE